MRFLLLAAALAGCVSGDQTSLYENGFTLAKTSAQTMFPLSVDGQERALKFDTDVCPSIVVKFFGADSDRAKEYSPEEEEVSLSKGGKAVEFLSNLRSGAGDFYETALHNIMLYYCEMDTENDINPKAERCVAFSEAAKDYAGKCIMTSDTVCTNSGVLGDETGTCESKSNCYWEAPVLDKNRQRRYTDEEVKKNEDYLYGTTQDSYAAKTGKYLAVGIVLAVLNILIWVIFTIGRCCCCCLHNTCICRCCSWKPKEEGYNLGCQVRFPIFVYIAFLAAIVGSAGVAYIGDQDMGKAFNSLFDNSRTGLGDLQNFLGNANTPMQAIGGLVNDAADASITILDGTEYVEYGMGNVIGRINSFATVYNAGIAKAGASNDIAATLSSLDTVEDEVVASVRGILDTLKASLVEGKDQMADALSDASTQIVELNNTVDGFYKDVNDLDDKVEDMKIFRMAGVLSVFALSLVCVLFGFLGVISYWTPCKWDDILIYLMNLTWFFGSFIVTLAFILAGITIFLAVFWNDTCHFLDIIVEDFEPYVGSDASVGMNACFNNTPLVDAFNLTSKVSFQEKINATLAQMSSTDLDAQFDDVAAPLNDINDLVKGITESTEFQGAVVSLNDLTNLVDSTDCQASTSGLSSSECTSAKTYCNFNVDAFKIANLKEGSFEGPWTLITGSTVDSGTTTAQWISKTGLAADILFARQGSETRDEWVTRVFKAAGVCSGADCGGVAVGARCNTGTNCDYPCDVLSTSISTIFTEVSDAKVWQDGMLIDLGVEYPNCVGVPTGQQCPTAEFLAAGNQNTVKHELDKFKSNITDTTNDIVNIANTAVGDIMDQVTIFLCNMNCGFVADLYNNIHEDLCSTLLGGVLQISAGFWFLGLFMFLNSALGAMLVVRLRGLSKAEFAEREEGEKGVEMQGVSLDLYN